MKSENCIVTYNHAHFKDASASQWQLYKNIVAPNKPYGHIALSLHIEGIQMYRYENTMTFSIP